MKFYKLPKDVIININHIVDIGFVSENKRGCHLSINTVNSDEDGFLYFVGETLKEAEAVRDDLISHLDIVNNKCNSFNPKYKIGDFMIDAFKVKRKLLNIYIYENRTKYTFDDLICLTEKEVDELVEDGNFIIS